MPQLSQNTAVFNWTKLEDTFRTFAEAINGNMPLEGDGIRIIDTPSGKLISASQQSGGGIGDGGGTAPLVWHGVRWMDIITVDPASCTQSTIRVLVNTGNSSDSLTIS